MPEKNSLSDRLSSSLQSGSSLILESTKQPFTLRDLTTPTRDLPPPICPDNILKNAASLQKEHLNTQKKFFSEAKDIFITGSKRVIGGAAFAISVVALFPVVAIVATQGLTIYASKSMFSKLPSLIANKFGDTEKAHKAAEIGGKISAVLIELPVYVLGGIAKAPFTTLGFLSASVARWGLDQEPKQGKEIRTLNAPLLQILHAMLQDELNYLIEQIENKTSTEVNIKSPTLSSAQLKHNKIIELNDSKRFSQLERSRNFEDFLQTMSSIKDDLVRLGKRNQTFPPTYYSPEELADEQ